MVRAPLPLTNAPLSLSRSLAVCLCMSGVLLLHMAWLGCCCSWGDSSSSVGYHHIKPRPRSHEEEEVEAKDMVGNGSDTLFQCSRKEYQSKEGKIEHQVSIARMPWSSKVAEIVASVLMYSICSMGMIVLNKLVMTTYDLNYPIGLLFIQNCGAVLLVSFAKFMQWLHYPDFDLDIVKKWLPLTFFFVAMLWTSMKSLHTMSVSAQTILKNLAIMLTAVGDSKLYGTPLTPPILFSFFLMILGGYMGINGDPWVTGWGICWTFANIVTTVGYTLYMKQLLEDVTREIGPYGPVFYNNLLSLPFLFLAALPSSKGLVYSLYIAPFEAILCLCLMVLTGSVMTFAVFWCMGKTSPTTFSVIGAVNKAPLAIIGIFVFRQFPTPTGYIGIAVALSGGFLYSCLRSCKPMEMPLVCFPFSFLSRMLCMSTTTKFHSGNGMSDDV